MSFSTPARACGIDFGTSNSTVGWLRPGQDSLLPLEDGKITLPSVIFFNSEERRPVYGRLALHEYLEGYEGRLMRSLKSLLGSKLLKSETTVLGSALPFKELLAFFIGELKKRAESQAGRPFEEVVLGRPVFFVDDDPAADLEAQNTLAAVAHKLGFKDVSFQYEPIAAAFDYESGLSREELVLIVDIGGGTSDFSLLRLAPERHQLAQRQSDILATGGVHIGGTDFDKQLSLAGVMPLFGYGSRMKSDAFMPTSYQPVAGRPAGTAVCRSDHLLRPAGGQSPRLPGGARRVPRLLLPRLAVPRPGRSRRARGDLHGGHAGSAAGRRAGRADSVPRVLPAAALRPVAAGGARLRVVAVEAQARGKRVATSLSSSAAAHAALT